MAREDEIKRSTSPMPTFARRPPTMSSFVPVDIPHRVQWLESKDSRYSELLFDKFDAPSRFFMLEGKIQKLGDYLF